MSRRHARSEARPAAPPAAAPSPRARALEAALLLSAVFAVWWAGAGGLLRYSHYAQYTYLADAFLHGKLHLVRMPNDALDMAVVAGQAYVVYGPFPALLLMPLVPVFQRGTPDVFVLALTALAGVWAFRALLVSLHGPADRVRLAAVTLTFALGTAMHYGAALGNVWLHAQVTATALQAAALWAAVSGRPLASGGLLGLTVLTRPTTTLALPLAAWLLATRREREPGASRAGAGAWLALGLPVAAAVALHAAYNWARFGSPLDAGYGRILMDRDLLKVVEQHGQFSLHFLPGNLAGWLARLPVWKDGRLVPDPHGMSLLLTTPYLLLAFWPRKVTRLEWAAAATFGIASLPSLLYYNDGWAQFGQRFALDGIVPALVVASFGAERAPRALVVALALWGAAVGAWGLQWFKTSFPH
jgi:hypothetical protein